MKVAFVLGSLNAMAAWQQVGLKVDHIYYFSVHELSLPEFPIPCYRLSNPQLDAIQESIIVERCIERNISSVASSESDAAIMRRALRLSELRIEAKCYLNAAALLQKQMKQAGDAIERVTFVSHYIVPGDVVALPGLRTFWHHAPHTRFFGLIPGLSRVIYCFRYLARARFAGKRIL